MKVRIENLKKCIKSSVNKINKEIKNRFRNISFKDVIYYSSLMIGNNQSYDKVNANLKINNVIDVSKMALIKYKNKISNCYFDKINNDILTHIYNFDKKRIIAVDRTIIVLNKSLENDNFKVSRNGNYCIALISTLFDVIKEIPINYKLSIDESERVALNKQFKYLKKDDILIMDRGYYSKKLLFELHNLQINPIFRLKNNLKIISKLKDNDNILFFIEYNGMKIKFRIIKYLINDKLYYLGTTIYDENIEYFKNLYWKRWKIEINFRFSKYNLSMNNIKSKNKNTVIQDIKVHNFIFIINSYLQYYSKLNINEEKYKINTSSHLNITINNILYLLLYKNNTKKNTNEILRILDISKQILVYIKPNRHYERLRKKPSSKWCQYGNKYKMIK